MSFWQLTNNRVVKCDTWLKRLRGIYFRKLSSVCLIYPCSSIHTFFLRKNIDVAFLDKNRRALKVILNLSPWKIITCKKSYFVLERFTNLDNDFINVGDKVEI